MAVEQEAPRHLPHHLPTLGEMLEWMGHHKTRLTMAAIALGGAGYLTVAHDRGSQNPAVTVNNPISDTLKPADPGADSKVVIPVIPETPPTAAASPTLEPPKPTATSVPEVKSLPDIINNKTANLVDLSPSEVQKIIDQAKAKGETVIALPDWIRKEGVEIREFIDTTGNQTFAVIAPKGRYEFPALAGGKISSLIVGPNNSLNDIGVSVGVGEDWFVFLPASATSTRQAGQEVTAGQPLVTFEHDPDSKAGRNFQNFLKTQVVTNPNNPLPPNTMAIIGLVKTDNPNSAAGAVGLTFKQLAKDNQNHIAVISK